MTKASLKSTAFYLSLLLTWALTFWAVPRFIAADGFFGQWFQSHTFLKFFFIWIGMAHLTITAMSIAFHRAHTHQALRLNPVLDFIMQTFLWMVTSMSKLDWVSVHVYHHVHSDTPEDAHSPKHRGFWHVFFLGAFDYTQAKHWDEVVKIRNRIPRRAFESFYAEHNFMGPFILTGSLILALGPVYGSILSILNFTISPLFAVGGVNALAHQVGYQNYDAKDNSRNIGFLFLLNWIICGELDHNNHHKFPKSPTFAHRWFEFDIGWVYLRMMQSLKLAKITGKVPVYQGARVQLATESEVAFVS